MRHVQPAGGLADEVVFVLVEVQVRIGHLPHPFDELPLLRLSEVLQQQLPSRLFPGLVLPGNAGGGGMAAPVVQAPAPEPSKRFPAHYLWAARIARIYEDFPLVCPLCGGNMRLIAFITEGVRTR